MSSGWLMPLDILILLFSCAGLAWFIQAIITGISSANWFLIVGGGILLYLLFPLLIGGFVLGLILTIIGVEE